MTDTHVLFGARGSGAASVEMALELAGLPYRVVTAATWEQDSALDELRRVNPLQQIPALVWPDGTSISESAAILIELGLRHPQSGLLPQAPAERAQAVRGLVYIVANCYAAIGVIDYPERWCDGVDKPLAERIRAGTKKRLHGLWDTFADLHAARPWLGGEAIGALDVLACVVSRWSGARAHLKASRPAWYPVLERIEAHPVVAPVIARHWPPTA